MQTPLYLIDTENVSFQPCNVNEAIILFNRMKRKNQINWEYVPELLQKLSANLNEEDHDRFCEWICNPCTVKPGAPGYFSEICAAKVEETDEKVEEETEEKVSLESDTPVSSHQ